MPQLEYVIKAVRNLQPDLSYVDASQIPQISLLFLKRFWELLADQYNAAAFWAGSCMCFFGFLCMGEVITPIASSYDPNTIAECATSVIIALFISTLGLGEG